AAWELVSGGQRFGYGQLSFELALSPTFADDHFAVLAQNFAGGSPASHNCRLLTTTDGGSTWLGGPAPGSYEGCLDVTVDRDDGRSRRRATGGRRWPWMAERRVGQRHPWMCVGSGAWGEHSRARFARASGGVDRGRPGVLVRPARQPYPAAEHPDRVVPDGSR